MATFFLLIIAECVEILRHNEHDLFCEMEDIEMIAKNFLKLLDTIKKKSNERKIQFEFSREYQTKEFLNFVENRLTE